MAVPTTVLGQGGGIGMRVVGSAATGAGQGALYGFGSGEGGLMNEPALRSFPGYWRGCRRSTSCHWRGHPEDWRQTGYPEGNRPSCCERAID